MSDLTPCPTCQRHVRNIESVCPFCGDALALSQLPHALPRSRLGRAATFAFGATLLSTSALVGCGGESESKKGGEGGMAAGGMSAGGLDGGGANAGQNLGGGAVVPMYGAAPAGGTPSDAGGASGGVGGVIVLGPPAAGSGFEGGNPGPPPK